MSKYKKGHDKEDTGQEEGLKSQEQEASCVESAEEVTSDELKKKAGDYDSLWNKHLRTCADFDNSRKLWDKERQNIIKFGNYSLVADLIVVVDELEHGLRAIKEHSKSEEILTGIEMTYKNLVNILKKQGLRVIEAGGKKFDPHVHEIVGQIEASDEKEHVVLEEVQKGYLLEDRLLRTSKVIIGIKKKTEGQRLDTENQEEQEAENRGEIPREDNQESGTSQEELK